jgi:hypothetical protein
MEKSFSQRLQQYVRQTTFGTNNITYSKQRAGHLVRPTICMYELPAHLRNTVRTLECNNIMCYFDRSIDLRFDRHLEELRSRQTVPTVCEAVFERCLEAAAIAFLELCITHAIISKEKGSIGSLIEMLYWDCFCLLFCTR